MTDHYLMALRRFNTSKEDAIERFAGSEEMLDDWLHSGLGWITHEDKWWFDPDELWLFYIKQLGKEKKVEDLKRLHMNFKDHYLIIRQTKRIDLIEEILKDLGEVV